HTRWPRDWSSDVCSSDLALLFIVTSTAEMERLPFDLPEAESEIMMGWQAEYPGPLFMLVQGPAFIKLYAFAALFSTLYLGGYLEIGRASCRERVNIVVLG